MSYQCSTLANGLRVASEKLAGLETVAIAISVDVGARHERPEQHGISHLLEHMAFKGTPTYSALQIAEIFDAIGGHLNAFTSHEHTVYYAKVLKEHLSTATDILCDILQHSLFDEQELAREQQVILQELAMHHDTPDDLVFDYFQETAFAAGHPLGRSILGTAERIQSHSADDLRAFIAQHYNPARMVVSAAGNIEHDALVKQMESSMRLAARNAAPAAEKAQYVGGSSIQSKPLEQLQLVLGMQAMAVTDARYYQLQLLSTILGGGMSSRLFQEIREKRGLVYTVQSYVAAYQDCSLFTIYAATGEDEAKELMPALCDELKKLSGSVSEEELQRAKQQHKASLLMARENTATVAEWMGRHLLQFGEYRDAKTIGERVDTVSVNDIHDLADELFCAPTLTLAALGPTTHVMDADTAKKKLAA